MTRDTGYDPRGAEFTADVRLDEDQHDLLHRAFGSSVGNHIKKKRDNLSNELFDVYRQFVDSYRVDHFGEFPEDGVFVEFTMDGPQFQTFTDCISGEVQDQISIRNIESAEKLFEVWLEIAKQIEWQLEEDFDEDLDGIEFIAGGLSADEAGEAREEAMNTLTDVFSNTESVEEQGSEGPDENSWEEVWEIAEDEIEEPEHTCTCCEGDECLVTQFIDPDTVEKTAESDDHRDVTWYECLDCGETFQWEENALEINCH